MIVTLGEICETGLGAFLSHGSVGTRLEVAPCMAMIVTLGEIVRQGKVHSYHTVLLGLD